MLKISFLGKLYFEYEGSEITDKIGAKTAALVALLMLRENKNMSREKATSYLWPDSNEESAKYNLRYTFWMLKKLVGEDSEKEKFLNIDKEYCGINSKYRFKCDILELLHFDENKEYDIKELLEIKNILRGDFFEGHYFNNCDEFNELILFERNNFENKKIKLLKKMVNVYQNLEKYEECINILNDIFKLDPYSEETAVKALDIHYLKNDRAGAVKFYKNFSNKLVSDLGIRPSSDLVSKYNEIKTEKSEIVSKFTSHISMSRIEVSSYCIKDVEFFWIADVIESIAHDSSFNPSIFEEHVLRDISCIVPSIWEENIKCDDTIALAQVRIVKACISFIRQASRNEILDIKVENFKDMDKISLGIYKYINEKKIENIKFSTL